MFTGRETGGRLYQFHTVGSRENLIPFHLSLSRCHSPPQVVIGKRALTASSRFLKEKKEKKERKKNTLQSSTMNACGRRQNWHIVCAQTWIDAALHTFLINRRNQSTLFTLCYSRVILWLVCKVVLIPTVSPIIVLWHAYKSNIYKGIHWVSQIS